MQNSNIFTIFAGVNGAGKSTLFHLEENNDLGVRLNSDEIIRNNNGDWNSIKDQKHAGEQLLKLQEYCFLNKINCNRETTLVGSNIIKSIETAKKFGFKINLRYVGVSSVEIAKLRIKHRVELGGHGVSDEIVERRFNESYNNFLKVFNKCDSVFVYDNSGNDMVLVAFLKDGKLKRTSEPCIWCDGLAENINK